MKKLIVKIVAKPYAIFTIMAMLTLSLNANGQIPQDTPHPDSSEPLLLDNPTNIIFFIILPILFVLLFLWLKKRQNR